MSEKRFEFYSDENLVGVIDTVTGRTFNSFEIVDCLNEQQSTITALKEENEKLKITLSEYGVDFSSLDRFKEAIGYNEMVKKVLNDE